MRRAPISLAVGALLAIGVLMLAAVPSVTSPPSPCLNPESAVPPVCFSLTAGTPYESGSTWVYPYTSTNVWAGCDLKAADLSFELQVSAEAPVPGWSLSLLNRTAVLEGTYNGTSQTWTSGATTAITNGMAFNLISPVSATGDYFIYDSSGPVWCGGGMGGALPW